MKWILFLSAFSFAFSATAQADDFVCELRKGSLAISDYAERTGQKRVIALDLGAYRCTGEFVNGTTTAYLYIPVLRMDQDIQKGVAEKGASVFLKYNDVTCRCGLM